MKPRSLWRTGGKTRGAPTQDVDEVQYVLNDEEERELDAERSQEQPKDEAGPATSTSTGALLEISYLASKLSKMRFFAF